MASLYKKVINGKPYFYLREMARVDGKPKMVSERYLGSAADIVAAMDRAEAGMIPERTRHLAFGDIAAVWSLLSGSLPDEQAVPSGSFLDKLIMVDPGDLGKYL